MLFDSFLTKMFYFKAVDFLWKIQNLKSLLNYYHEHEFLKPYLGLNLSSENISKSHSLAEQAVSVWS